MPLVAGHTFLYPLDNVPHLWVIATEPCNGIVAIVNFTSLKGSKDQTVVLLKHEHAFLRWDTSVNFAQAETMSEERLQEYIQQGRAKMHSPIDAVLVQLIVDGFCASPYTKNRIVTFVAEYRASHRAIKLGA